MKRKRIIKSQPVNIRVRRYRRINNTLAERRAEVENEFINHSIHEDFDTSQESNVTINIQKPLKEMLRSWVNYHRITTRAVNDLLNILKKSGNTIEKNLCFMRF